MPDRPDGFGPDEALISDAYRDSRIAAAYQVSNAHLEYIYRRLKEMESTRDQVHDHTKALADVVDKVDSLYKTVVHNNGTAVLSRLAKLEFQFAAFLDQCNVCRLRQSERDEFLDEINLDGTRSEVSVRSEVAALRGMIEGYIKDQQQSLRKVDDQRWGLAAALLVTVVGSALTAALAFLS